MYGYEIFHENLMNTLFGTVRNRSNANTYIFEGAKGLSKHDAAKLFAKSLVCDNTDEAPCCQCDKCVEADASSHPDIIFVEREKDKATIGVEPVRKMIEESLIKPFYNKHKVFIINEGDLLTVQAQNAFLKTIEEPPEYAIFIIVCTDTENLLETVRSRAVTVTFSPVSDDVVLKYIESKYPEETRLDFLVNYCAGIPKYADEIINRKDFDTLRDEILGIIPRLLSKNKLYAYDVAEFFEKHKENADEIYDIILMYLHDALITVMGHGDNIANSDKTEKIYLLAQKYTPQTISSAIDEVATAKKMLKRNIKASATAMHAALCIK